MAHALLGVSRLGEDTGCRLEVVCMSPLPDVRLQGSVTNATNVIPGMILESSLVQEMARSSHWQARQN
jgi:hypothetical protein